MKKKKVLARAWNYVYAKSEAVEHATKLYRMEKVSRACHTETSGSLKTSRAYRCINGTRWAISVSSFVHCKGKGNRD